MHVASQLPSTHLPTIAYPSPSLTPGRQLTEMLQEAQRSNEGSPQVVMVQERFRRAELMIFLVQDNILVIVALLAVCWAYWQIRTLDFSVHPITLLDDVLLYVPLPFFFIYFFMS